MSTAPRPSAATLQNGMRIDRYEVLEILGAGGFGAVYRARHVHTHQIVAMKVLRSGARENATAWDALLREAKAMASIGHPNIVRVYDAGVGEQGTPFLVMEFVEGVDLGKLLQNEGRALMPARAIDLMLQVLAALAAAHARGVVHRDVKPANVIVRSVRDANGTVREQAMLLDFGISKLRDSEYARTQPGLAMGTPGFMAPEQIENAASADARSDVYAAAVTLYLLLAGRLPFDGTNPRELISNMLLGAVVPLHRVAPHVVPALATVVDHALSRDPAHRWADAASFAAALESANAQTKSREVAIGNAATVALDPISLASGPTTAKSAEDLGTARTVATPSMRPPAFGPPVSTVGSMPSPSGVPASLAPPPNGAASNVWQAPAVGPGIPPPQAAAPTAPLPATSPSSPSSRTRWLVAGGVVLVLGAIGGAYALGTMQQDDAGNATPTTPPSARAPTVMQPQQPAAMPTLPTIPAVPTQAPAVPNPSSDDDDDDRAAMAAAMQALAQARAQMGGGANNTARNYGTALPGSVVFTDGRYEFHAVNPPMGASFQELEEVARRAVGYFAECRFAVPTPIIVEYTVMFMPAGGRAHVMPFGEGPGTDPDARCLQLGLERATSPTLDHHAGSVIIRVRRN